MLVAPDARRTRHNTNLTFTGPPIVPAEAEPQLAASQTRAVAGEDFMACNVVRDPANNFRIGGATVLWEWTSSLT